MNILFPSKKILTPTQKKRIFFFLFGDSVVITFSLYLSFLLRFDFSIPDSYIRLFFAALPIFWGVKISNFFFFRLYKISWRFVSLKDCLNIIAGVASASAFLTVLLYFFHFQLFLGFPRGIILIDTIVTLFLASSLRISKRVFMEILQSTRVRQQGKKTLIIGAGSAGEMILRDIQKTGFGDYAPLALLDDDPHLIGSYLHGVKIIGGIDDLKRAILAYAIEAIIIAIPSLTHKRLFDLYTKARETGIKEIKIVPRIYDVYRPEIHTQSLEEIKIEDLIGRQVVRINTQEIHRALEGKSILITGAGGSIGFELTLQVCRFNPRDVILFEIDETELHLAEIKLFREFPQMQQRIRCIVGDIRDRDRVEWVFATHKPDIVFHAAAYKHVPMMEYNSTEAVKVNILGTHIVASAANANRVERFVMISTDKAVRPTSIMGATKRFAEHICRALNEDGGSPEYISVRFGNVLGSRGSVLPLFLAQIEKGGPLTVTHPDMQRYFMTIPEAVSLVLQASVIGRGGDIMVLDMGDPVNIMHLAEKLLRLHGLVPYQDMDIQIVGMRPGEKLFEEILSAEEGTTATRHEKIFVARTKERHTIADIEKRIARFQNLLSLMDSNTEKEIRTLLREYIQWYAVEQDFSSRNTTPSLFFPTSAQIKEKGYPSL